MSLRHILLGMLHEPQSGYDLKKEFEGSARNFWNAELSQIYPTLAKLKSDGCLTSEKVASDSGPQRVVYSRTDAGRDELVRWFDEGPTVGTERIEFLAQVYFLAQLGDLETATGFFRDLRQNLAARLEHLKQIEAGWAADGPGYPDKLGDDDFFPQLVLDCGLRRTAAAVDWCDSAIARIEARARR